MLLPEFDYHAPTTLDEAFQILSAYGPRARLLAGGTDLLVDMKHKRIAPEHIVAVDRLPGLEDMARSRHDLSIGGRVTATQLSEDRALRRSLPALAEAAGRLGSPLIRNRATLAGNLVTARPAADLAPPLLALGAAVVLAGQTGQRTVPVYEFFVGPGESVIRPDEILTRVVIPRPEPGTGGAFFKLGVRRALERSIVSVAVQVGLTADGRRIETARVALGAVAPTPVRSIEAEKALVGHSSDAQTLDRAARAACGDACPRGVCTSPEYSIMMVEVLTRRALQQALARARRG